MDQHSKDNDWQRLQDNIINLFGIYSRGSMQKIEYKPLFTGYLPELSADSREDERTDASIPIRGAEIAAKVLRK